MPDDLKVIALKLDQLTEIQERTDEKMSDVRERLFDPDEGIYARMKDMTSWAEQHEHEDVDRHNHILAWTAEHEKQDVELRESVNGMTTVMEPLVDDYKIRMNRKKWTDKLVWLVLSIIITALVGTIWSVTTMVTASSATMDKPTPAQHDKKK